MAGLKGNDIDWAEVTLHVGAGTFKPVDAETLGGHTMHREYFTVTKAFVGRLLHQIENGRPVVTVGTTSLRCLESLFYLGAGFATGETMNVDGSVEIGQWVAEDNPAPPSSSWSPPSSATTGDASTITPWRTIFGS